MFTVTTKCETFGRKVHKNIASIEDAVKIHNSTREASYEGASTFYDTKIVNDETKEKFVVSYNGRVWKNKIEVTV